MQTLDDTELDAAANVALESPERKIAVNLWVDWNKDGQYSHILSQVTPYVSQVRFNRALSGSAPSEILLIEGSAEGEMTFVLSGKHDLFPSWVSMLSPYNGASPFYQKNYLGAEVYLDLGVYTPLGIAWYRQFTGNIMYVEPDRGSGEVTITVYDRAELLRTPGVLPDWAISEYWSVRGQWRGQLCDTRWLVDSVARKAGISPTMFRPTTREEMGVPDNGLDGCHFWLTGNGSYIPTIGWVDSAIMQRFMYTEVTGVEMYQGYGPLRTDAPVSDQIRPLAFTSAGPTFSEGADIGTSPMGDAENRYWVDTLETINLKAGHALGFTLNTGADNYWKTLKTRMIHVRIGDTYALEIWLDGAGKAYSRMTRESNQNTWTTQSITIPTNVDSVPIHCLWDISNNSGLRYRLGVGDTVTPWTSLGANPNIPGDTDDLKGLIIIRRRASASDYWYGSRNITGQTEDSWGGSPADYGRSHAKYRSVLTGARNRFSYMPDTQYEDGWDLLTKAVAAEWGSLFFDERGVLRFWSYDTVLDKRKTVSKVLPASKISGLKLRNSLDSIRNNYNIETGRKLARPGIAFQATSGDEFYVPGQTVRTFVVNDGKGVQQPNPWKPTRYSSLANSPYPAWDNENTTHGYIVQWADPNVPSGWRQMDNRSSGVDIRAYKRDDGSLCIRVWNGYEDACRFIADDDMKPRLRIEGTLLADMPKSTTTRKDAASIAKYGKRNLSLSGDWYQDQPQTNWMLDKMLPRTSKSIPVTDAFTAPGDPRIQLGDVIQTHDPDGVGETMTFQILGITREVSPTAGLRDTYSVEVVDTSGIGIWDSEQYGRWDTTFTWSD